MSYDLSLEQLRAIAATESRVCIIACAGSGKTTTLTARVARLIDSGTAAASNIAVITFTVLAADKLRLDLDHLLREKASLSQLFIGTIHSFCLELIRLSDPLAADAIQVLDEGQQFILLNKHWTDWAIQELDPSLGRAELLDRLATSLQLVKAEGIPLERIADSQPHLYRVITQYERTMRERHYMDFADLLRRCHDLLIASEEFRQLASNRFRWLFVDEFQDVDPLQNSIIELLGATARVCVVGDDDQAIYQFRGTDVRNLTRFANSVPPSARFTLDTNFRCRSNIVTVANGIIEKCSSRLPKQIRANKVGGRIRVRAFPAVQDETRYIIRMLRLLRDRFGSYRGIAILMRSLASYGEVFIDALRSAAIPYLSKGDRGLFKRTEVQYLVQALEVVAKDILEADCVGQFAALFSVDWQVFTSEYGTDPSAITESNLDSVGAPARFSQFLLNILTIRQLYLAGQYSRTLDVVYALLPIVLTAAGTDNASVMYNLCAVTQLAHQYDEIERNSRVHRLCLYFALHAQRTCDENTPLDPSADAVHVLTVHQAKGLEYRAIFLPMLISGRFPLRRGGVRWLVDESSFDAQRYKTNIDDERRLFYVGATRAVDYLFLSRSRDIGLTRLSRASVFFTEAANVVCNDAPRVSSGVGGVAERARLVTSYSSLEYYLTCPYRYLLLREYGLATPANPFFGLGRALHSTLRIIHERSQSNWRPTDDEIRTLFEQSLTLVGDIPPYVLARRSRQLTSAISRYVAGNEAWLVGTRSVETPFDVSQSGAIVRGRIDLLTADGDGLTIVDWKTGNRHEYLRTDLQMKIYALAARKQLNMDIKRAVLYYVEEDEVVQYEVTDDFVESGRAEISEVVLGIRKQEFAPRPGSACTHCECRKVCQYAV